jgi:hypothetical protein
MGDEGSVVCVLLVYLSHDGVMSALSIVLPFWIKQQDVWSNGGFMFSVWPASFSVIVWSKLPVVASRLLL